MTFIVLGIGIGILLVGLIGRRLPDAPRCEVCRFDLTGRDVLDVCPECGQDLALGAGVTHERRRRRRRLIVIGLVVLLVGAGNAFRRGIVPGWLEMAPLAWLVGVELPNTGPVRQAEVLDELTRRTQAGDLTDETIERIALIGLDQLEDAAARGMVGSWPTGWGDFVIDVDARGTLSGEDLLRFLSNTLEMRLEFQPPTHAFEARPRLVIDRVVGDMQWIPGRTTLTGLAIRRHLVQVEIDSMVIGDLDLGARGGSTQFSLPTAPGQTRFGPQSLDVELASGEHLATVVAHATTGSLSWTRTVGGPVELLASDPVIPTAEVSRQLREAIRGARLRRVTDPVSTVTHLELQFAMHTTLFGELNSMQAELNGMPLGWVQRARSSQGGLRGMMTIQFTADAAVRALPPGLHRLRLLPGEITVRPPGIDGYVGPVPLPKGIDLVVPLDGAPESESEKP